MVLALSPGLFRSDFMFSFLMESIVSTGMIRSCSVKVGDLVRLKTFCQDSGRLALLVALHRSFAKIMFVDSASSIEVYAPNLEVISESR